MGIVRKGRGANRAEIGRAGQATQFAGPTAKQKMQNSLFKHIENVRTVTIKRLTKCGALCTCRGHMAIKPLGECQRSEEGETLLGVQLKRDLGQEACLVKTFLSEITCSVTSSSRSHKSSERLQTSSCEWISCRSW